MNNKGIPNGLKESIELRKKDTIDKVQQAISEIQEDSGIVTKSKLIAMTKLSSSTFSTTHVKRVLEINKVCQYANRRIITQDNQEKKVEVLSNEVNSLYKEISILKSTIQDKDIIITRSENKITKINQELKVSRENYELLLGKLHLILQELDKKNVIINTGFDIL